MIRVCKPPQAPTELAKGEALVRAFEAERLADPSAGASSKRAFKFDKKIYGASKVKRALRSAQHDKCCYCEGKFAAHASGDVEHFRPKTCVRQEKGGLTEYPGYYWLAYDWWNLYYACELCNRIGKRDLFPVADPAQRRRSASDSKEEIPEILDPGGALDPRDHIKFREAAPEGVTELGRKTIQILGLDRGDLTTARLERLQLLNALRHIKDARATDPDSAWLEKQREAIDMLRAAIKPTAPFSAMAQDFLASE